MSAWSDLPNATQIDRVIASLKKHPEIWGAARNAAYGAAWSAARDKAYGAAWSAARDKAYGAARDKAYGAARSVAWSADWDKAYGAARSAAWSAARDKAYGAARSAIIALIAYDDCDQYLSMSSEQLRAWALLSENPAAVLLLPAVAAFERIAELETV